MNDNDNDNGGEDRRTQPTTHSLSWRFVAFRHYYVRACIIRVSNLNVGTFRSCRAAAYTAMRDKDRAMLLLSCCLRCTPWPLGSRFAFNRFIVSLSLRNYRIPLSNYRNSLGTILSYRYRTIISKLLIRCPPLVEMHQLEVTKSQL